MRIRIGAVAAVLATAVACSTPAPASTPAGTTPAAGRPHVLVTGLEVPWGIAFLPDGSALVTQRIAGTISRVAPTGQVTELGTVEGVTAVGEGGLLGIAVSPDHATDRQVFVMYTGPDDVRVVRLTLNPDGTVDGTAQDPIVAGITKGRNHDGGQLRFGPDGFLYVTTGEAGRGVPAQDPGDLGGKILRVTRDGAPAPGNPSGSRVWSLGHRNPQGIAWDPAGTLYATEFGQNTWDEINLITPGANYGWPEVEGQQGRAGYVDPLVQWATDDASPSGLAYAGALRGERLWKVPVDAGGGLGTPEPLFQGEFGRIRAVAPTPDGAALWLTTSNRDGRGDPGPDDDRILVLPLR